ncbi:eukaryotic translation initiation factor 3 subunit F [Paracoccidioides brasiliensis Pb03]|uniref:Eukaryotic translation initiation factor 3 subunit F n=2 Tax=Paracoccidioides brasiliensis TaxID=121759 RepID=C1G2D0_PARBD|nr:eukaryotic translation initiation factor 3 subunit F [Paracoccidioides brasiliensis Pb18]EEH16573.1 eukaryotic translation initiation factor 3 subunit F [Paracoccidioides brasiliensis Pb03]EEH46146.1 eukaryotic translation initiation factor 3 subunit F [Paracoccidioides brasiliensis Pb18]ODH23074.1 eukaryotic translation initiation factor 3 subunit F [Paracoccidioides brasiliensis]ODH48626.1 eukaryotic translation initiation factor 3 subunit F [Paracoccidioides brasiliensis]
MADTDSFLHLSRPLGPAPVGAQPSTGPLNVVILPQAIFSILDHSLRRNADQERVIGTLLGTRSEDGSEVEIRSCFAVGHTETTDQVEVDMEYQKQMLALHLKANPKEVLVGWYATSSELNTFSALIQNFYGSQGNGTWPHPAVHLTVSTVPGKEIETRTYISAPVGVTEERAADSAAFIPVPYEIRYGDAERNGLEAIAAARDSENHTANLFTDIEALEKAIEDVLGMIDRVSKYVENVMDEEAPASTALGQFLLNALALAPKVDAADIENDFNNHIQDVLVVSYLANTIRTQMELSNRLATAQLTLGGEGAASAHAGGAGGESGGQRGGRGGGRGRGGQQRIQDRGGVEA